MKNKEYADMVDSGIFPESPIVPIDNPFIDERGKIINILTNQVGSVSVITSKAGTERSNHYHLNGYHYLYILSGSCIYYERSIDSSIVKEPVTLYAGQMFFTPPMMIHKVVFIEDSILLSLSKLPRDHENHEKDVVREEY